MPFDYEKGGTELSATKFCNKSGVCCFHRNCCLLVAGRTINTPSPGSSTKGEIEVPSLSSQPIISDNCRQSTGADTSTEIYEEIAAVEIGDNFFNTIELCCLCTRYLDRNLFYVLF